MPITASELEKRKCETMFEPLRASCGKAAMRRDLNMRKAIVLAVTALMALTLVGCGGGNDIESASTAADPLVSGTAGSNSGGSDADNADAAAVSKPDAQAVVNTPDSSNTSSGSTAPDPQPEPEACPWNIPAKSYAGYDRFSGEKVDGLTLVVHEVTADRIVFDYATPARALNSITASVDSSGHASTTQGTVTLELTLGDGSISVDEIEGMGAMAYIFK